MADEVKPYYVIRVKPLYIAWSNLRLGKYVLNDFQALVYRHMKKGADILAHAPTGGGKTLTLLLSPWLPWEDMPGFIALYPNNTLLMNQFKTVSGIVEEALEGKVVTKYPGDNDGKNSIPMFMVYEIKTGKNPDNVFPDVKYVALIALSGKYLLREDDIPKREVLYKIAEKVYLYNRRGGVYVVVFSTPDTFLLVYTGAYRSFDLVGKALHNILVAIASGENPEHLEDVLRKTGVLRRGQESPLVATAERLLAHPLFIDEFHLYDLYEVDALYAVLKLFKTRTGLPIVFSSATPAMDILGELTGTKIKLEIVDAPTSANDGFPVRCSQEVYVLPVSTKRKGFTAYFEAGDFLPDFVSEYLVKELVGLPRGKKALVIFDRLWMVSEAARRLLEKGVRVRCIASIYDETVCVDESNIIFGSEATTQGVNLGRVVLGAMSGISAEDVVQRIGRFGRKGVPSRVYLVAPYYRVVKYKPSGETDYYGLVEWISNVYLDYSKRKRSVSRLLPLSFHEMRRKLIHSLGIVSIGRVSGNREILRKIELTQSDARKLLDEVIGEPESLVRFIIFRRTGFTVEYVDPKGKAGNTNIGLITRNFTVEKVLDGKRILIDYTPSRGSLMFESKANPAAFKGRFIQLKKLLEMIKGKIIIDSSNGQHEIVETTSEALVYVESMGKKLADYISYTGEGAIIRYGTRGDYAIIFI